MWVCEKMGKTSNILWTWSVLTWFDHEIWWYSWFSDRASMIWSRLTFRECRTMSFNEFPMLVNSIANQLPTVGVCMCVPSSACRIKTWSRVAFCGCCYQEAIPCWWLSVQCIFLRDICDSPAEVFLPMKAGQRYGMCFSSQNSDWLAVHARSQGLAMVKSGFWSSLLEIQHWIQVIDLTSFIVSIISQPIYGVIIKIINMYHRVQCIWEYHPAVKH